MSLHPHRHRALWLCGALHAFTHIYMVALLPLYLLIRRDLGLMNDGQVTFLVTAQGLAYFAASYPMGILADRFSRKELLRTGLLINGLAYVGLSQVENYSAAVFWCVVAGLGGSFYHPAATAMLAELFPNEKGKALGKVGIGAAVGFWIGPTYAGWRAAEAGWRAPVLELGLMGTVAALLFAWLAPNVQRSPFSSVVETPRPPFVKRRLLLLLVVASILFGLRDFGGAGMGTLSSLYFQKCGHMDIRATGYALGWMFLASVISNPLFGSWSDRSRLRWALGLLVMAAGLVAIMPLLGYAWGMVVLVAYGFFFMASYPVVEAALMESVPERVRGRVFGFFITVGGSIASLSHWWMGRLVSGLENHGAWAADYVPLFGWLAGLIMISTAGLPCLFLMRRHSS